MARRVMTEALLSKELFGSIAFVLTFVLFVPYIRSIRRGETIPHPFSWMVWGLGTFIVCFAQLADGAGIGAWPIGLSGLITCYIAYLALARHLALARNSLVDITRADWVLFLLALSALPAWYATSDPLWAVILLTTADLMGFGPTLRRAYRYPYQEHASFFAWGCSRNLFVILALEHYSWTTVLFPAAVGIACLLVAMFLVIRRRMVPRRESEVLG